MLFSALLTCLPESFFFTSGRVHEFVLATIIPGGHLFFSFVFVFFLIVPPLLKAKCCVITVAITSRLVQISLLDVAKIAF